jgi:hydroxymethylbilane synthase
VKIGTRGSDLATTQTGTVAKILSESLGIEIKLEIIKTKGDQITDRPLRELEGRGYFTKEIEDALLDRRVDLAVHSFKDMPSEAPDGLALAAVSEREDPADLLIIHKDSFDADAGDIPLKQRATVGTSAVRRQTQISAIREDFFIKDLRGNVPTRLRKLSERQYDAIFLASAGVRRLGLDLSKFEVLRLDPVLFVPSPGQGVLAIQMRADDKNFEAVKKALHSEVSENATDIERSVLAKFGGGCSLPLGAYARKEDGKWHGFGFWGGNSEKPAWAYVNDADPRLLGDELYEALLKNSK